MIKKIFSILLLGLVVLLPGCLQFNTVSYDVNINDDGTGTVNVFIRDIRSDADSVSQFEQDKANLFNYMLKGDDFINSMKKEGKDITSRKLIKNGDTLDAEVVYSFDKISAVENIMRDKDFYYLTLQPTDSVVSTNGEVIVTPEHKRILWDSKMKNLKFEMFSQSFENGSFRPMALYYNNDN